MPLKPGAGWSQERTRDAESDGRQTFQADGRGKRNDYSAGRWGEVTGRVVVHQDDGGGRQLQRPAHDLARIDRRVVDGAVVGDLVGDQLVLAVEVEDADLLARLVLQRHAHIGKQRRPGGDHRPLGGGLAADPLGQFVHQLQVERRSLHDARDRHQLGQGGREHRAQAPEAGQQRLGLRLDVAHLGGAEQIKLQHLIVGDGGQPTRRRALPQPLAMADIMGDRRPAHPWVVGHV